MDKRLRSQNDTKTGRKKREEKGKEEDREGEKKERRKGERSRINYGYPA